MDKTDLANNDKVSHIFIYDGSVLGLNLNESSVEKNNSLIIQKHFENPKDNVCKICYETGSDMVCDRCGEIICYDCYFKIIILRKNNNLETYQCPYCKHEI